ncbi:MAG: fimbrillin family protein [Marinifilaceae bacterium]
MNKYTLLITLLCITFACSKNGEDTIEPELQVLFSANMPTKVIDDTWEDDDRIGVYMIQTGKIFNNNNVVGENVNREYKALVNPSGVLFKPTTENYGVYFPEDGGYVDFYAYYPFQNNTEIGKIPLNVSNQAEQAKLDFMTANTPAQNKDMKVVPLQFMHKLVKIDLMVVAGDGYNNSELVDLNVKIKNVPLSGVYNFTENQYEIQSTGNIDLKVSTADNKAEAIIIPIPSTTNVVMEFKFNNGIDVYHWDMSQLELTSGKKLKYTVRISKKKLELNGGIEDWVTEERNGVEAL